MIMCRNLNVTSTNSDARIYMAASQLIGGDVSVGHHDGYDV